MLSNRNFCSPYKNSDTSKKNQEWAFFGHFWTDTKIFILFKFSNHSKILWVFYNGRFRFYLIYQLIDTTYSFLGVWNIFKGPKWSFTQKKIIFLLQSSAGVFAPPPWIGLNPPSFYLTSPLFKVNFPSFILSQKNKKFD